MSYREVFFIVMICGLLTSCLSQEEKDEQTARQYCSSCHTFPDAKLLPRETWETSVMPQMSFRMGRDISQLPTLSKADQAEVLRILPAQSMVSEEQWQAIQRYYQKNAPESMAVSDDGRIDQTLDLFTPEKYRVGAFPLHTFTSPAKDDSSYLVGSRLSKLYRLNTQFSPTDSFSLESPPSMILNENDNQLTVLLMGIMDPNDQAKGKLIHLNMQNGEKSTMIDSLKRPVHVTSADLDGDGLSDYVICSFGNYTGNLTAFRNRGNGTFERRVLVNLPGARKTIIRDFDNNGMPDIMALMSQGDERLILLLNQGRLEFRQTTLLTFPPVYGSSYFDLVDFNGDGNDDILYTNGDNADYSMVLKPYHGVRIYLNNGKNEFKESWFYNMHGASEAVADDFDKDGDVDIAAVSFFPQFDKSPEQGFIYFENTKNGYVPHTTPLAREGRWLRISAEDVDSDGDKDILLTALDFNKGIPEDLLASWKSKPVSILVLRNQHQHLP
ncbi:VCBS repeat-containing protein [Chryseolinea sp. T2]|uniref:FG-GAP repeat domain-containing protein n=1 Tax=Chryseolinea sp. T2 TaxID=3129255 RepID=UPI00307818A5